MEEGGIPITADPRKNDPFFQGPCRFGYPHCITEMTRTVQQCMWYTRSLVTHVSRVLVMRAKNPENQANMRVRTTLG